MVWSRRRRAVRALGHGLIVAAGAASIAWPAAPVQAATSPLYALAFLWSSLLIVGGALCGFGVITGRWFGEYAGLWPLIAAMTVFGLAAATSGRGLASTAGACVLFAWAALLTARWLDLAALRQEAIAAKRSGG